MNKNEPETFCPTSQRNWRAWLKKNHQLKESVWLIYFKKSSNMPSLSWSEAVDEALCFGWIDSIAKPIDEKSYKQFFSKRKPKSIWSKINKEKVRILIDKSLMQQAGYETIERAKLNDSWKILDDVEEFKIPNDLEKEFKNQKGSKQFFLSLSKSTRKAMLQWLVLAKKTETRQKRIMEIAELAAENQKPKQF